MYILKKLRNALYRCSILLITDDFRLHFLLKNHDFLRYIANGNHMEGVIGVFGRQALAVTICIQIDGFCITIDGFCI